MWTFRPTLSRLSEVGRERVFIDKPIMAQFDALNKTPTEKSVYVLPAETRYFACFRRRHKYPFTADSLRHASFKNVRYITQSC